MNPAHEIDAAMREAAALRDKALRTMPALSSARRAVLAASLVREFPIEAALLEVAANRDKAVHPSPVKIPAAVEFILNRQLAEAKKTPANGRAPFWLNRLRLPLAAGLALCLLLTAVLPRFGVWEAASRRKARSLPRVPPIDQMSSGSRIALVELFPRELALSSFNLKTNEPASLQLSSLANSIRFTDGNDASLGLRLDLPARVALAEDWFVRTP